MNLEEIITAWRKKYFQQILLFNFVLLFAILAGLGIIFSVLIYCQIFFWRFLFPLSLAAATILVGINFYRQARWLKREWLKFIARATNQKHSDDIVNALSLKRFSNAPNLTGAMARFFRRQILENLIQRPPEFRDLTKKIFYPVILLLIFIVWLIIPPRPVFNFIRWYWLSPEEIFQISPGDGLVDYGQNQEIRIDLKTTARSPVIFGKTSTGWQKFFPRRLAENTYTYIFKDISEDIFYYVAAAGWQSRVFCLKVVRPPEIGFEEIEYYYPAYTGLGRQVSHLSRVQALAGTRVVWKMRSSQQLKNAALVARSKEYPAELDSDGQKFRIARELSRAETYYFQLETRTGRKYLTEGYDIEIIPDNPPMVEITLPAQDLRAQHLDVVPVVVRLDDDFGIKTAELVYRINAGEWLAKTIKEYQPAPKSDILVTEIKLSEFNLQPGDRFQYYWRATDNSLAKNFGRSLTYEIEIVGYAEQHQEITEKLKQWQKDLIRPTGRQGLVVEELRQLVNSTAPVSSQSISELFQRQQEINQQIKELTERLADILAAMERDPFNDFYTYSEFQAIKKNLQNLSEENLLSGAKNLAENKLPAAYSQLSLALSALEKMAVFSEDVQQYQQWRSLLDRTDDSLKILDTIEENLARAPDPEKIVKELKEIEKLIGEIEQLLATAPQDLPEEFVNQPAIKELNFNEEKDLLQQLSQQIARGDFRGVENLLQQLRKQLAQLKETLARSGESIQLRDSSGKTAQQYQRLNEQLQEIIRRQTRLLNTTSELENQRQAYLFRYQEQAMRMKTSDQSDLSRVPEDFLKDKEKELTESVFRQTEILGQSKDFYQQLNDFSRQTASLPLETLENISAAIKYQQTSAGALGQGETATSIVAQQQALQKLQDASQALKDAQQQYLSSQQKSGQKTAGSVQPKLSAGSGSGGLLGIQIEPVRLPRPEDFHPPREFRQEILDALKEKYPSLYEKNIKEYYQRLLEQ